MFFLKIQILGIIEGGGGLLKLQKECVYVIMLTNCDTNFEKCVFRFEKGYKKISVPGSCKR